MDYIVEESQLLRGQLSLLESMVHEVNMGPSLGRQDQGGPHVGPMKLVIWVVLPDISRIEWSETNIGKS